MAAIVMKRGLSLVLLAALSASVRVGDQPEAVTRVVDLLTELQSRVNNDEASEQAAYDKFACWCETMTKKKALAIETVRDEIRRLGHTILQLKGTIATTLAEIADLVSDIKKNEKSQKQATAIRQKQNAEFVAEKTELQQAIAALESAVTVLRDATHNQALLRKSTEVSKKSKLALESVHAIVSRLPAHMRPESKQMSALQKYAPQSDTVQGILTDMYHTFATTLETRTTEEATAHRNYEDLMHTYAVELATLQKTLAKKEAIKTEAETMLADATQAFSDAEAQLKSDVKFFDATKESCSAKSDEWGARKALRAEELEGISKALEILTSDEAKEIFAKAIKPGFETKDAFLQLDASRDNGAVGRASRVLEGIAKQGNNVRLAALVATLRSAAKAGAVGHFEQVIEAIDAVISELLNEATADEKKEADCKDQLTLHASTQADLEWKIQNNEAKIAKLEQIIAAKEEEKTETLSAIEDVVREIGDMESQRTTENADFLQAKSDDEKAIELLEAANTALAEYQAKHGSREAAKLLQEDPEESGEPSVKAPDAKFSKKDTREVESKGVVSILKMIIEDLHNEISNGVTAEEAAQLDFEKRLAAAKDLETGLNAKKANLDEVIASKNEKLDSTNTLKDDNSRMLSTDQEEEAAMRPDCEFMLKNIATRRSKRDIEVGGLREAKSLLAGMNQVSMAQISPHFDDSKFSSLSFASLA